MEKAKFCISLELKTRDCIDFFSPNKSRQILFMFKKMAQPCPNVNETCLCCVLPVGTF